MKQIRFVSAGFSLVELTLALGVAGVSLLAIFGLLATGSQINHSAIEQTASSDILTTVAADLRATPRTSPPGGATSSPQFGISIPANPVGGSTSATLYFNSVGESSVSLNTDSRYRLVVTFLPNGARARTATFVNLRMTWPAAADPTNASTGAAETFVALDRN
jgi:uncharacterized protein (TIGR02598 family)